MSTVREVFKQELSRRVIVGDGAMATWLHQSGVPVRTCYEHLCLAEPNLIQQVHRAYVKAGAGLLQSNTFSGHRPGLARYGLEDQMEQINRAGVAIARAAAPQGVYVFGTIGSIVGLRVAADILDTSAKARLRDEFRLQAEALLSGQPDGIVLETFADYTELALAVAAVRDLTDLPLVANLSPEVVGVTRDGVPIHEAFAGIRAAGADIVGLNCRLGPSGILRTYEELPLNPSDGYAAVPNAGLMHMAEGDISYTGSPEYFGEMAQRLCALGVRLIGGCCGTTPDHIAAVARAVSKLGEPVDNRVDFPGDGLINGGTTEAIRVSSGERAADFKEPATPQTLLDMVSARTTVIVELDPPRTLDCERFFAGAEALKEAGADYVTLADNSLGSVRVSNMALATELQRLGIEPLVHVTCRDRNLIGQQSHLMGLHVLGIHHILLVTGDPSRFGDLPGAASVFDTSSIELTAYVKRLNSGIAFSGQPLKTPSRFVVGTSFNPNVANLEKAFDRLRRKVAAGADFVMTQPVYDPALLEPLRRVSDELQVPVFVGVMPLTSARNAYFLHNEVPGIRIPESLQRRLQEADPAHAVGEGIQIAKELIDEVSQYFSTIYLITPFLRYSMSVELLHHIRSRDAQSIAGKMRTFG